MIESYTNTSQTIAPEGLLSFATNDVLTGCTGAITGATAGAITVNLLKNGVALPGATATQTSASATDIRTVNFSKIVQVLPSCCAINNTTTLTFQNAGLDTTYSNVNVVITKLA